MTNANEPASADGLAAAAARIAEELQRAKDNLSRSASDAGGELGGELRKLQEDLAAIQRTVAGFSQEARTEAAGAASASAITPPAPRTSSPTRPAACTFDHGRFRGLRAQEPAGRAGRHARARRLGRVHAAEALMLASLLDTVFKLIKLDLKARLRAMTVSAVLTVVGVALLLTALGFGLRCFTSG